ncbi:TIGR03086 family metal-binding protein [Actinopolymorpha alba]|uniref:TIGR03086 family metal-binding protein n=1 Tax=Actinopolymorpha alba TaxID=533267 RepID=UPI00037B8E58|nr:TIGR03086 family metal-binding protein [Actinopolymorpha alba]
MTKTQESARTLMPRAARVFSDRVHGVPANQWTGSTPCTEWTVRDLVNHLASEHLWAPHILGGETIEQVGDRYDGDVLGTDPVATWDAAIADSLAAWARTSDDAQVHLSFGDTSAEEYAEQMLFDLAVHAWDLARGAGLDERLDPVVVRHVWAYASEAVPQWQGTPMMAPPVPIKSDDQQDKLIALTGRRP